MVEFFKCRYCKKEFVKKIKSQKYCSEDCKAKYYKEVYYKKPKNRERKKKINLEWYNRHKDEYNAKRRKPKRKIICKYCNSEVEVSQPTQKFCNMTCRNKYWHEKLYKDKIRIREKAKRKLSNKTATRSGKFWTKEEDEFLLSNKGKMTYLEIALELHRSLSSISYRMCKLNKEEKEKQERLELEKRIIEQNKEFKKRVAKL